MNKILWILGAGASRHLGASENRPMPLLAEFKKLFEDTVDMNRDTREVMETVPA